MAFTVQQMRSDELNRRPTPTALEFGQIGVNYNNDSPGMFIRSSTGSLVKIGPCHIGVTAPAPTNWSALSVGELWLDTNGNYMKVWNGSAWISVVGA